MEEADLKALFEAYGDVDAARIITDKFSRRSKGFRFVEMPDDEAAQKAIDALNNSEVSGRRIVVNQAEERKEKPRGGGYGNRDGGGYGNRGGGYGGGRRSDY